MPLFPTGPLWVWSLWSRACTHSERGQLSRKTSPKICWLHLTDTLTTFKRIFTVFRWADNFYSSTRTPIFLCPVPTRWPWMSSITMPHLKKWTFATSHFYKKCHPFSTHLLTSSRLLVSSAPSRHLFGVVTPCQYQQMSSTTCVICSTSPIFSGTQTTSPRPSTLPNSSLFLVDLMTGLTRMASWSGRCWVPTTQISCRCWIAWTSVQPAASKNYIDTTRPAP